jgi:hypothetical protein
MTLNTLYHIVEAEEGKLNQKMILEIDLDFILNNELPMEENRKIAMKRIKEWCRAEK